MNSLRRRARSSRAPTRSTSTLDLALPSRELVLEDPRGRVDYLLFVDGQPAGVIEAKPEGTTLVEVEHQSGKYVDGLPGWMKTPVWLPSEEAAAELCTELCPRLGNSYPA
jgi:hypothetical protein